MGKDIFVGISGGVDSAVTLIVLKNRGYNPVAVHLRLFDNDHYKKAKFLAEKLGVDYLEYDEREKFREYVIDYFKREYFLARTPNPCIACNYHIKFGILSEIASSLGVELISMGHYARVYTDGEYKYVGYGKDRDKDQSYFLARLDQKILNRMVLPLGDYLKSEIRKIALEHDMKKDVLKESNEVCFALGNYVDFMKSEGIGFSEGDIVYDGKVIGKHKGYMCYTIGQRRGLGIGSPYGPLYVAKIDRQNNVVYVDKRENVEKNIFCIENLNIIGSNCFLKECFFVKVRNNHEPVKSSMDFLPDGDIFVTMDKKDFIAPGQMAVFYSRDKVAAYGTIK